MDVCYIKNGRVNSRHVLGFLLIFLVLKMGSADSLFLQKNNNISSYQINTNDITFWGYQLQQVSLQNLKSSNFDLLVIDYSQDGSNNTAWSPKDLNEVKNEGKILVSYISIGEAEDYRYYWQNSWLTGAKPDWLGAENPNWKGNYKVKYWEKGWQDIVYHYLDIIMAQGFNGVYLDIIDAYQYYQDQGISNAEQLMIDFVHNISDYTRNIAGTNFLIIPQNGEQLLGNETYRSFVSGIGVEDLFYQNDGTKNTDSEIAQRENYLDLLVNDNKLVLTVDYVQDKTKQQDVYTSAKAKGYIPYTTVLDLNKLTPPFIGNTTNSETRSTPGFGIFAITGAIITTFRMRKGILEKK